MKAEAQLVDPHGLVKIVFCEDDIKKVKDGATYVFRNLRVKRNKFKNELYVNPAKDQSEIEECASFSETLAVPADIPDKFVKCDIEGQILGVSDVKTSACCVKCEKPIKDESSSVIVVCSNTKCNLKQKATCCIKKWSLKPFVSAKEESTTLILITIGLFKHSD